MIPISFPFSIPNSYEVTRIVTENDFTPSFSLKHKVYYNLLRPLLPLSLRKKFQEYVNSGITYKDGFIDSTLVDMIRESGLPGENLYPERNVASVVLTHDVETEAGFNFIPTVIECEKKYGFKSSWNIVPYKYPIDEGIIRFIRDAGHEIGIHGYNHDGKLYYSEKIFNERTPFINKALKEYGAVGFRSPMVHRNLNWLQKLNIQYDASCFDYDPFQPFPGGSRSIWPFMAGKFIELPYTLPQDHTLFYVLKEKDITIWKKKTEWIFNNHGVVLVLTHPDYLKESNHIKLYVELLQYLKSLVNVWHCLPNELAWHWRSKFE